MSRRIYKQDYVSYWNSKGEYGKERVRRMFERKKKRYNQSRKRRQDRRNYYCPYCGRGGDCW